MALTLNEHLRREQFRLATLERDQERHALVGGYCPLHTWQYAAIASPPGIYAGSAKLAASVADALESVAQKDGAADDLAGLVAALSPRAGTRPLCSALSGREQSMISEIAVQPAAAARGRGLCLRHLSMVLSAAPEPGTGRDMIRALAGALRRAAEDMRAYALKRKARHAALVTDEESEAYLDALRRLAGLPALSQP